MVGQTVPGLRVVVPTDRSTVSQEALPYAQAILSAPGTSGALTLLSVVPERPTAFPSHAFMGRNPEDLDRTIRKAVQHELTDLAETMTVHLPGISVTTAIERGDPADAIIQYTADHDQDLIVMTTHGRGTMGRFAYGSVADRVARTAPVPVLLVRSTGSNPHPAFIGFGRIVVLLDTSPLSGQSLPVVQRLATLLEIPVALVTVIDVTTVYEPMLGYVSFGGQPIYDGVLEAAREEVTTTQSAAADALGAAGLDVQPVIAEGPVLPTVLQALRPDDLIVMTSHGRGGLKRWVLGSTAEKLLRSTTNPLLLVRLPSL